MRGRPACQVFARGVRRLVPAGNSRSKNHPSRSVTPCPAAGAVALMIHKPSVIKRPVLVINGRVKSLGFVADQYAALFAA